MRHVCLHHVGREDDILGAQIQQNLHALHSGSQRLVRHFEENNSQAVDVYLLIVNCFGSLCGQFRCHV